ncbi:30S ribosomal protein S16 [Candidatus Saccharibacteria bacterium]|nr:30S ribosomal protein S16 [Candidatus Saccharibacteria bacterium]
MLAIRMQRTGRSGQAQFRVIVQDSRFSPKGGRVVAYVGDYDPHTKVASLHMDIISSYLDRGAQPSDRVARLLKKEGLKLPKWVNLAEPKKRAIRNPDKLRRNRPPGAKAPEPAAQAEAETAEPTDESAEPTDAEASETVHTETAAEEVKTPEIDPSTDLSADVPAGASAEAGALAKDEASVEAETSVKTEVVEEPVAQVQVIDPSPEVSHKEKASKEESASEKSSPGAGKEEQKA